MLRGTSCLLALVLLCGVRQAGAADGPRFIAHLPEGTVELVGVTDQYRPTTRARWWQPDGLAAPIGPFSALQKYPRPKRRVTEKPRTFLVRFENLPADASGYPAGGVSFSTAPPWPAGAAGTRSWVAGAGPTARNPQAFVTRAPSWDTDSRPWLATCVYAVKDAQGVLTRHNARPSQPAAVNPADTYTGYDRVPHFYKMFGAIVARCAQTTDLRVGVSMGEWETVVSWKPGSDGRSSFHRDGREWTVTLGKAKTVKNTTRVVLKSSLYTYGQWNRRLVAVAGDGSEYASSIRGPNSGSDGNSGTAVFPNLPRYSIKEFRLQVRPFRCVEFDNISLEPGQRTVVTVMSSDDPVNTEK